ncbi:hypothetical protein [Fibrobacter intestinalis]|uniref:Uncharacterized protein n=1 Tax=Fibrobacter intestinalis TaxID=28122 RepID=A0A1T4RX31_9BACT|nr:MULTISPECIES: hypothetical protein [Fibrobacter]PBC72849.1 hypothetical protein BGW94_0429 [Fibrobacter sp. NR9]SKA20308.1 hypothetical protein SAMN02745108_02883 [Fibrobacter intestinalis]
MTKETVQPREKVLVKTKEELQELIQKEVEKDPKADLNFIDVSQITDMSGIFSES